MSTAHDVKNTAEISMNCTKKLLSFVQPQAKRAAAEAPKLITNMQQRRKIKHASKASDSTCYFLRLGFCFLSIVFATSSIIIMQIIKKMIAPMLFSNVLCY